MKTSPSKHRSGRPTNFDVHLDREKTMNESPMTQITIRRPEHSFGALRSFTVKLDGRSIGKVLPKSTATFDVQPGAHAMFVSMDWVRSEPVQFTVSSGASAEFVIRPAGGWWRGVVAVALPTIIGWIAASQLVDFMGWDAGWLGLASWFAIFAAVFAALIAIISAIPLARKHLLEAWALVPAETAVAH